MCCSSGSRSGSRSGYRSGNRSGCSYCNCNRPQVNYVSYVINGSYAGRNSYRSSFYCNNVYKR